MFKLRAALCLGLLFSACVHAQQYPSQAITIVVGFSPGGSNDVLARLVAPKLAEKLKVPVVVDNKPGAAGDIGLQYVRRAKPDGYTLYLASTSPLILNPLINKNIKFNVKQDIVVVNTMAKTFQVVASTKFNTVQQLVEASKKSQVSVGTGGVGGNNHMLLEVINSATGGKITHVPYKGTAPVVVDLLSKQLDGMIADYPVLLGTKGSNINVLAVADAHRSRLMPNVPTFKEALNIDVDVPNWFAFVAPKGTPDNVKTTLSEAIKQVVADKDVQQSLDHAGFVSFALRSPVEADSFVNAEDAKLRGLVSKPEILKALQNF